MPDRAEVLLAEPEQDRPVDLRVAPDEVLRVRLEGGAVLVVPGLARDVAVLQEHLARVPVLGLAGEVAAALEQQDALARRSEPVSERASSRAGADDDHVVVVGHGFLLRRVRSATSTRRWRRAAWET